MKPNKLIACALALLAPVCAAAAGEASDDADQKVIWGVRAMLDLNIPGDWHGDGGA